MAHTRPTSPQIVLEPDEDLTQEVRAKIPLPRNSGIKVRPVDGFSGIAAMRDDFADVIVIDAFAGARVPGELVSVDFLAQCRRVLHRGWPVARQCYRHPPLQLDATGTCRSGHLLRAPDAGGAESSTLKGRRFGNVVIAASNDRLPLQSLERTASGAVFPYRLVHSEHLERLVGGAQPFHGRGEDSPGPPAGRTFFE